MATKKKIWEDWKLRRHAKSYDDCYSYHWENGDLFKVSWWVWASVTTKDHDGLHTINSNVFNCSQSFKTKEEAMIKAQELILTEYKKIKRSMVGR